MTSPKPPSGRGESWGPPPLPPRPRPKAPNPPSPREDKRQIDLSAPDEVVSGGNDWIAPDRLVGPAETTDVEWPEAVAGWVVIVAGPGRGADFRVLPGVNCLGRGPNASVRIEFGDLRIAEGVHCRLTYDPRSRRWFLSPGETRAICYVEGDALLTYREIVAHAEFELGSTRFRFIPFCSSAFSWANET